MLSLAQIESSKFRKTLSVMDIRETVKEIMDIQQEKADFNQISFTVQFMNFFDKFHVCTDEQRLQQILLNLQSNALKFTPKNGSVRILVSLNSEPERLEVSVIDSGPGIKKEDQKKLFKLFGFLRATQQLNAKGIGLGLYICKKLANRLDGDVTVDSEWEKGSTFTLTLPVEQQSESQKQVRQYLNPKKGTHNTLVMHKNGQ